MLRIDFKECCRECGNIEVETNIDKFTNGIGEDQAYVTIGCEHQCVCKEYREQTEIKRLVKS